MAKKMIEFTGKIKKLEMVKGTDRLTLENLDIPQDGLMQLKKCANNEEAVKIFIQPLQENLPSL